MASATPRLLPSLVTRMALTSGCAVKMLSSAVTPYAICASDTSTDCTRLASAPSAMVSIKSPACLTLRDDVLQVDTILS